MPAQLGILLCVLLPQGDERGFGAAPERDPRVLVGSVDFTTEEVEEILRLSPLPPPPPDPTNSWADDDGAARLGQALFHDPRLSADGTVACSTCHVPERSWTDGRSVAVGLAEGRRNTPSLWNVAHNRWFYWDGRRDTLWAQALTPLETPSEQGTSRLAVAHLVASDPAYRRAYEATFGELPPLEEAARFPADARPVPEDPQHPQALAWARMSAEDRTAATRVFANAGKAIAAYERRLLTPEAPFDVFVRGLREGRPYEQRAITDSAKRGLALFLGRARCVLCHSGPSFTDLEFHDTRLPDPPAAVEPDLGRYEGIQAVTADPFNGLGAFSDAPDDPEADAKVGYLVLNAHSVREFKTPTLRNVRYSAPYQHDGRFATLEEVLGFYSTLRGAAPRKAGDRLLVPVNLTERETEDLLEFLDTLSSPRPPEELVGPPPTPYLE